MHTSIPVEGSVEVIESTQLSPLVSRCKVKVLYIDHKPNRNGTVMTKKTAEKIGKNLPGSPVVGYYNAQQKDFEEHNQALRFKEDSGKYGYVDITFPYGFVPTDSEIWFQNFKDDDGVTRTYLCCDAIIWTEAFPESKRILTHGNNQSMQLHEKTLQGNWAEDPNTNKRFFIINEAIIEKLCILGENYEPCFEGAQIKTNFSLHDELEELRRSVYSLQATLKEGGFPLVMEENKDMLTPEQEAPLAETPATEFKKQDDEDKEKDKAPEKSEGNSDKENTSKSEEDKGEEDDEKKKKGNYSLDEIPEYTSLMSEFQALQTSYSALETEKANLETEIESLRNFKLEHEREDKKKMIDSFYMLSDEQKNDVVTNIDTYSLSEIESKLAVLCYRNGLGFNQEKSDESSAQKENEQLTYSLNAAVEQGDVSIPAWLQAVRDTEKEMH